MVTSMETGWWCFLLDLECHGVTIQLQLNSSLLYTRAVI